MKTVRCPHCQRPTSRRGRNCYHCLLPWRRGTGAAGPVPFVAPFVLAGYLIAAFAQPTQRALALRPEWCTVWAAVGVCVIGVACLLGATLRCAYAPHPREPQMAAGRRIG